MTYTKKLTATRQDPDSKTKKPAMICHYEVEVDGLGNFETDVTIPGTVWASKAKTRGDKIDKLVDAAVADTIKTMQADHAG